jgi:hypothetical protein
MPAPEKMQTLFSSKCPGRRQKKPRTPSLQFLERRRLPQRASPGGNENKLSPGKKRGAKGEMMANAKVCPHQPICSSYYSLEWALETERSPLPLIPKIEQPPLAERKAAFRRNILCECCRNGMCHALNSGHFLQNVLIIHG